MLTKRDLGWNDFFERQRDALGDPELSCARVAVEYQDRYQLIDERGTFWAQLSGKLRHEADRLARPAVGDWVAVRANPEGDMDILTDVLDRATQFVRQVAGRRVEPQVVAANIDTVFVVTSFNEDFNPRRLERYLTAVWDSGAEPVIVVNKADLCPDGGGAGGEDADAGDGPTGGEDDSAGTEGADTRDGPAGGVRDAYMDALDQIAPGVARVAVSALDGEGVDALAAHIAPGRTVALLGSSGVGKSTLVNRLLGREAQRTAPIRDRDGRGQHTTTHRELIPLPGGGILIDTPGMRELKLWASEVAIEDAFEDIHAVAEQCRFRDCGHDREPGCAVRAAVEAGTLDPARLDSFRKQLREQARQDSLLQGTYHQDMRRTGRAFSRRNRLRKRLTGK